MRNPGLHCRHILIWISAKIKKMPFAQSNRTIPSLIQKASFYSCCLSRLFHILIGRGILFTTVKYILCQSYVQTAVDTVPRKYRIEHNILLFQLSFSVPPITYFSPDNHRHCLLPQSQTALRNKHLPFPLSAGFRKIHSSCCHRLRKVPELLFHLHGSPAFFRLL